MASLGRFENRDIVFRGLRILAAFGRLENSGSVLRGLRIVASHVEVSE